ncbi:MAG TPA: aminotransferase class I/II-fold pyridoxal phosphate-dependent enzyme [Thermoanaerobaculia bacterium]|nr:aminotransferase class I/II-fold pyridoxal phosphate-dependent enzyme [Thermoanaerobaculia bacterium]
MAKARVESTVADLTTLARDAGPQPRGRVSSNAAMLVGSEILKIASEMRTLRAGGRVICDLTVGDFDPRQFPIPERLRAAVASALERGETNYPPATGMPELRRAVQSFYERDLGLRYPIESVLIAGGARPAIYCLFRTLCDPGDRIVFPVPSWNNNHYVHLVQGCEVPVECTAGERFLPTAGALREQLAGARLLCLNSPLNPTGTVFEPEVLEEICVAVLDENEGRQRRGERPLYLMYDQIYWQLCFGDTAHVTPPGLVPEMARFTVMIDGISKSYAATGLRVGWAVGPVDIVGRMSAVLGHVGAWAPRAEQLATVEVLDDPAATAVYLAGFRHGIEARLDRLHAGFQAMKAAGLPADSIPPMGAIYLTARMQPFGRRTPQGAEIVTNEDIRRYVLEAAGIGVVPFQAFDFPHQDGWFRLSVGAASEADIEAAMPRLSAALQQLG